MGYAQSRDQCGSGRAGAPPATAAAAATRASTCSPPPGTPLVAVTSGTISRLSNQDRSRGGISLWLRDARGTVYYYAHNQHNLVRLGQEVRAGQLLARVGATGNAKGGPPHLHFQLHPGGGRPVSPDAVVRRWCR